MRQEHRHPRQHEPASRCRHSAQLLGAESEFRLRELQHFIVALRETAASICGLLVDSDAARYRRIQFAVVVVCFC